MKEVNAASVAVLRDHQVLLIRRAHAPFQGMWTLPGGRLEAGEDPEACARREIREELGLELGGLTPIHVLDAGSYRLQVFATYGFEGAPRPSPEVRDWRWIDMAGAAGLETTPGLNLVLELAFATAGQRDK